MKFFIGPVAVTGWLRWPEIMWGVGLGVSRQVWLFVWPVVLCFNW